MNVLSLNLLCRAQAVHKQQHTVQQTAHRQFVCLLMYVDLIETLKLK